MNLLTRKWRYGAGVLLLLLAMLAWWLLRTNPNVRKVRELQAAMRQLPPEQRAAKGKELRDVMEKLTPEQRRDVSAEGRKRFEQAMLKYPKMSKEEKTKYLDEQIDRMERARQQMTGGPNTFASGP